MDERRDIPYAVPWFIRLLVGANPRRTLLRIAALVLVSFVVFGYVLAPIRIVGISMLPTFRDGQIRLVNRLAYRRSRPQRGDIVAIRYASDRVMLLKRIIGLPGERIAIQAGTVYIDRQPLNEPYARRSPSWFEDEEKLAPDDYYVIGDNRTMAREDHEHGRCDAGRILGKVLF